LLERGVLPSKESLAAAASPDRTTLTGNAAANPIFPLLKTGNNDLDVDLLALSQEIHLIDGCFPAQDVIKFVIHPEDRQGPSNVSIREIRGKTFLVLSYPG
jgi:hypothetical protein